MGAKRRHYTDEERATFVAMLKAEGYPERLGALKKVADFARVHPNVLRRWWKATRNPPPTELVIQKIEAIDIRLEQIIHKILDLLPEALEDANTRDLALTLGIAVDKHQLIRGQPTERQDVTVHDQLTDSQRTERLVLLLDAAGARRNGRPAAGKENTQ